MGYRENIRELDDIEYELDLDRPWSEDNIRIIRELSDMFLSDDQVKEKGRQIGHFKADKKSFVFKMLFSAVIVLGSCILMKISPYFAALSIIFAIAAIVWLWRCSREYGTYITIYEHAITGRFEFVQGKKWEMLEVGTAYFKTAWELKDDVYILLCNEEKCSLRHMKNSRIIAYLLNRQKGKEGNAEPESK